MIREARDIHVAVTLEAEHRAVGRELAGSRPLGGDLHAAIGERVDVEIGDPRTAVDRLEVRLKDEMLRVLRPLEPVVAEWLVRARKGESSRCEENRVFPAGRIVGTNDRRAGRGIAVCVGVSLSAFYPVDASRPLSAVEDCTRLHCLVHVREPLLFLRGRDQRQSDDEPDEKEPG